MDGNDIEELTSTTTPHEIRFDETENDENGCDTGSLFTVSDDLVINSKTDNNDTSNSVVMDFSGLLVTEDMSDSQASFEKIDLDSDSLILIDEMIEVKDDTKKENSVNDDCLSYVVSDWDILSAMQHNKNHESSSEWDAVSSVQSIMSMDTFHTPISYKEILEKKRISTCDNGTHTNMNTSDDKEQPKSKDGITLSSDVKSSPLMLPFPENEDSPSAPSSPPFDEYHELEGYKYGRGGKKPYHFRRKKNQKEKRKISYRYSV